MGLTSEKDESPIVAAATGVVPLRGGGGYSRNNPDSSAANNNNNAMTSRSDIYTASPEPNNNNNSRSDIYNVGESTRSDIFSNDNRHEEPDIPLGNPAPVEGDIPYYVPSNNQPPPSQQQRPDLTFINQDNDDAQTTGGGTVTSNSVYTSHSGSAGVGAAAAAVGPTPNYHPTYDPNNNNSNYDPNNNAPNNYYPAENPVQYDIQQQQMQAPPVPILTASGYAAPPTEPNYGGYPNMQNQAQYMDQFPKPPPIDEPTAAFVTTTLPPPPSPPTQTWTTTSATAASAVPANNHRNGCGSGGTCCGCKTWICVTITIVSIVVVLAALIAIGATAANDEETRVRVTVDPNKTFVRPSTEIADIVAYLNTQTLSDQTLVYYPSASTSDETSITYEDLALIWAIELDPLQLIVATSKFRLLQRYALAVLFVQQLNFETTGGLWTTPTGWLTIADECSWYGITCRSFDFGSTIGEQMAVTSIALSNNNVHATLPAELGLLGQLTSLDVSYNDLYGTLPYEAMNRWSSLASIDVSHNVLTGSIASSLGASWTNLESALFNDNELAGSIPSNLCALSSTTVKVDIGEVGCDCCDSGF